MSRTTGISCVARAHGPRIWRRRLDNVLQGYDAYSEGFKAIADPVWETMRREAAEGAGAEEDTSNEATPLGEAEEDVALQSEPAADDADEYATAAR
jgi:hypothetical protein